MELPKTWASWEALPAHLCLKRRSVNVTRPSLCGSRLRIFADVQIRRPNRKALVEELGVVGHLPPPAEGLPIMPFLAAMILPRCEAS